MNASTINDLQGVRQAIDAAIADRDFIGARALLGGLETGPLDAGWASFINSRFAKLQSAVPLRAFKLAVLRSFTIEPIVPVLRAVGLLAGLDIDLRLGAFNAYSQELLDPGSWLGDFPMRCSWPYRRGTSCRHFGMISRIWTNFRCADRQPRH